MLIKKRGKRINDTVSTHRLVDAASIQRVLSISEHKEGV